MKKTKQIEFRRKKGKQQKSNEPDGLVNGRQGLVILLQGQQAGLPALIEPDLFRVNGGYFSVGASNSVSQAGR